MSTANGEKEAFGDMVKRKAANCAHATGLCCFKAKTQTQISALEYKIAQRQKKFGVDYINLIEEKASEQKLKACLSEAHKDVIKLRRQIDEYQDEVDGKEDEVNEKIVAPPNTPTEEKPKKKKKRPKKRVDEDFDDDNEEDEDADVVQSAPARPTPTKPSRPPQGNGANEKKPPGGKKPSKGSKKGPNGSVTRPNKAGKPGKGPKKPKSQWDGPVKIEEAPEEFKNSDPSKWAVKEFKFAGNTAYDTKGREETITGVAITKGIRKFKANPGKYVAMMYQTAILDQGWPEPQHKFIYVHREGTQGYKPAQPSPDGWMTMLLQSYERLPSYEDNVLPKKYRDKYTDKMTFRGQKLHTSTNKPYLPGRGMGIGDDPLLKIIGDVDPSDISQGMVGDCWLLSGISSLAEFDGAVKNLFRKTKNLDQRPFDGPNMYTITLWDLATWKEVDIEIDERLCAAPNNSAQLLGSKPSEDSELWVCYLEKALAIHCGGWDKIVGGQCTQAWAMLTGCKEQYTIRANEKTGKYICLAKYNPFEEKWIQHGNSPHDGDQNMWQVPWPKVGGGGGMDLELTEDELFLRMVAWDEVNYIVGAGTRGTSDKHSTGGLVDNHAYSVIESRSNVCGTGIDLIRVRNPWGSGEIEDGEFDDDGPGWDKYPQIKKELNPVVADDGIFWVTKKEFFHFYETVFLSASNMTRFLED